MHILLAKSNASSFTYDGIELGGERITHEIEDKITELEQNGCKITKLSVTGYSLGGLVARYAIGLLYSNGWFDRIQPVNFTTFASPHLGVRTPLVGPHSYIWNVLGARTLSTSGRQLFLIDSFRDTGRPLLAVLADPDSIFVRALSQFKHKTLYANCTNDRSAPFYTTAISRTDPYVDMEAVELNPDKSTNGVLLNPHDPVRPKALPQLSLMQRIALSGRTTIQSLPFYLLLTVLLPIGSVLFLANSGYQTIRSAQRVRAHEAGQAGIGLTRYRIPLIEEARHLGDRVYRGLGAEQGEDYLPTPPGEEDSSEPETEDEAKGGANGHGHGHAYSSGNKQSSGRQQDVDNRHKDKFPTLALTNEQFEMIENLDRVGWIKYHVNIKKVRHTHACIIVRIPSRRSFDEGRVVVGHWVKEFEI